MSVFKDKHLRMTLIDAGLLDKNGGVTYRGAMALDRIEGLFIRCEKLEERLKGLESELGYKYETTHIKTK